METAPKFPVAQSSLKYKGAPKSEYYTCRTAAGRQWVAENVIYAFSSSDPYADNGNAVSNHKLSLYKILFDIM